MMQVAGSPGENLAGKLNRKLRLTYRRLSAGQRALPDFLILGAMKAGTSTLFEALVQHPQIIRPFAKELHYFDTTYYRGLDWYRSLFPRQSQLNGRLTGEATPYYLFHPAVPKRVKKDVPRARFIVILRDPVARAYSHYRAVVRRGQEKLSFEEALEAETRRIPADVEERLDDPTFFSPGHQHFSYLAKGHYTVQLKNWLAHFPREQFLILESGRFRRRPQHVLDEIFAFLDLASVRLPEVENRNVGRYPPMEKSMEERLRHHFAPYNQQLYQLLGVDFDW